MFTKKQPQYIDKKIFFKFLLTKKVSDVFFSRIYLALCQT